MTDSMKYHEEIDSWNMGMIKIGDRIICSYSVAHNNRYFTPEALKEILDELNLLHHQGETHD